MCPRRLPCIAFLLAASITSARAQETTRVSVDSAGVEGDLFCSLSDSPAISADGRYVAFVSSADNLVAGDTNGYPDVFVHDRVTGITERVSVDSSGLEGNGASGGPSLSADGRYVAFHSSASNLVAGDANGVMDVFVHDRVTGVTEIVSVDSSGVQGDKQSLWPAISADGMVVAFASGATNFVANDTNFNRDVFVHDRGNGITERVSVSSTGGQGNMGGGWFSPPAISADGQIVAFESTSSNLVPHDSNFGADDVFVHDRSTGMTEIVSVKSSGMQGDGASLWPSLSADGQVVAFCSDAMLVVGDSNHFSDVYVHERATRKTRRVSVDSTGNGGDNSSAWPSISADGQMVSFASLATNLVAGDGNGVSDVFVHDRQSGETRRLSVDSSGVEGDRESALQVSPAISADGLVVVFSSEATNLVSSDTNGWADVFAHELCSTPASWSNYGAGFPGTNGVPAFTARQNPVLGASLTLDLLDSSGAATSGLLFVGFQRTSLHSGFGGDLLVLPALVVPIAIPATGATFDGTLPHDDRLCGAAVDLQALEADPGAAKGVSFTAGLELLLGR
jgi:Tol biopolymer transport system component